MLTMTWGSARRGEAPRLLAGETFDEVAAHDLAAVLHPEQHVAQARPVAGRQLTRHDAVARQQEMSVSLVALLGAQALVLAERAPATEDGQVTQHPTRHAASWSTPVTAGGGTALRHHVGNDCAERVGRHEPGPEEIP